MTSLTFSVGSASRLLLRPLPLQLVQVGWSGQLLPERFDVEGLEHFPLRRLLGRFWFWYWYWSGLCNTAVVLGDVLCDGGRFGLQGHGLLLADALQLQLDLLVLGQQVLEGLVNTGVSFTNTVSSFTSLSPRQQLL